MTSSLTALSDSSSNEQLRVLQEAIENVKRNLHQSVQDSLNRSSQSMKTALEKSLSDMQQENQAAIQALQKDLSNILEIVKQHFRDLSLNQTEALPDELYDDELCSLIKQYLLDLSSPYAIEVQHSVTEDIPATMTVVPPNQQNSISERIKDALSVLSDTFLPKIPEETTRQIKKHSGFFAGYCLALIHSDKLELHLLGLYITFIILRAIFSTDDPS